MDERIRMNRDVILHNASFGLRVKSGLSDWHDVQQLIIGVSGCYFMMIRIRSAHHAQDDTIAS